MKRWAMGVLVTIATASAAAQPGPVPDPTPTERRYSVETGHCVVRENRDVTARMLRGEADTAIQNRFMVLVRTCASTGKTLYPNVVMGAAAEKLMAERGFGVERPPASDATPTTLSDDATHRLFACAITARPESLTRLLRTGMAGADEVEAIQAFRVALVECDATRGERITPVNVRALAAKAAFVMAHGVR